MRIRGSGRVHASCACGHIGGNVSFHMALKEAVRSGSITPGSTVGGRSESTAGLGLH